LSNILVRLLFTPSLFMLFDICIYSWCIWCQRLHPTWEKFAEELHKVQMPVGVGKVNCVTQAQLCKDQRVMAFPTLRWYKGGEAILPDYKMDRTVDALLGYTRRKLEMEQKYKDWETKVTTEGGGGEKVPPKPNAGSSRPDHPGCQVSGHLMVNRVPGNFHIEAKSVNHNLNAAMTNLTHRVNHLSFGEPITKLQPHMENTPFMRKVKRVLKQVPDEHKQFNPMDDKLYVTSKFHQAFHHYIKVVSTHLNMGSSSSSSSQSSGASNNDVNSIVVYQMLEQSQIVFYDEVNVPEARFSYDMSPMSVVVQKEGRKWYDYLTSLCAIIGGTFTTLGLIDATLYKVFKPKKL
jgi:thiol-disulfide isomerase/thioredoxin